MTTNEPSRTRRAAIAAAAGLLAVTTLIVTGSHMAGAAPPAAVAPVAGDANDQPTTTPTVAPPTTAPTTTRRPGDPGAWCHSLPWPWSALARLFHPECRQHHPGPTTTTTTTTRRPGEVVDCGSFNAASGWPTTRARVPNECIQAAFDDGTPATYTYLESTQDGTRLLRTTYEVIGPRSIRVTVDPTTAASGDEIRVSECTSFTDSYDGIHTGGCTVVETRPVTAPSTETRVTVTPVPPVVAGQPVTLAVSVTTAAGDPVDAGTVTLVETIYHLDTERLDAAGRTAFTRTLGPGTSSFTVVYNGTPAFRSSTAPVTVEATAP